MGYMLYISWRRDSICERKAGDQGREWFCQVCRSFHSAFEILMRITHRGIWHLSSMGMVSHYNVLQMLWISQNSQTNIFKRSGQWNQRHCWLCWLFIGGYSLPRLTGTCDIKTVIMVMIKFIRASYFVVFDQRWCFDIVYSCSILTFKYIALNLPLKILHFFYVKIHYDFVPWVAFSRDKEQWYITCIFHGRCRMRNPQHYGIQVQIKPREISCVSPTVVGSYHCLQ